MKTLITTVLLLAFAAPPVMAQPKADEHTAHHPASAAAASADLTDGEVRKVDKAAMKVTIKHAEIKSLDMPPMTMVFQVRDTAMLDKLQAGDKIRFVAEKAATGYVVTDIRPVP